MRYYNINGIVAGEIDPNNVPLDIQEMLRQQVSGESGGIPFVPVKQQKMPDELRKSIKGTVGGAPQLSIRGTLLNTPAYTRGGEATETDAETAAPGFLEKTIAIIPGMPAVPMWAAVLVGLLILYGIFTYAKTAGK